MLTTVASAIRAVSTERDEFALRHNALTHPYTLESNVLLERQAARPATVPAPAAPVEELPTVTIDGRSRGVR